MPQSPELAAGEGFTYEGDVAAFYLVALLAEAYAPGVCDRKVVCVSVQQRDFGEPLDDVIVDFEDIEKNRARLSLQVKQSLVISNGATNSDFRAIIRDCWGTLNKSDFRENTDHYGFAVGNIAMAKGRALENLCEFARESPTVEHFEARFANGGNANAEHTKIKSDIESLVSEAKVTDCTSEDIHRFLAHFVFIQLIFYVKVQQNHPKQLAVLEISSLLMMQIKRQLYGII